MCHCLKESKGDQESESKYTCIHMWMSIWHMDSFLKLKLSCAKENFWIAKSLIPLSSPSAFSFLFWFDYHWRSYSVTSPKQCSFTCMFYINANAWNVYVKDGSVQMAHKFPHLYCLQQWIQGCFRGAAWLSDRSQPLWTKSVPPWMRRSSLLHLLPSTSLSTPHQSDPFLLSPAALWFWPLSAAQIGANLQRTLKTRKKN